MDFLEQNYINFVQNEPKETTYKFRDRTAEKIMNEMDDAEFKRNFRFSKDAVKQITDQLEDHLG
jgi:hypothetical protein